MSLSISSGSPVAVFRVSRPVRVTMWQSMLDGHMTGVTEVEGLAAPRDHQLHPLGRGPPVALEIGELVDVVALHRATRPTLFAFLMQQPLDALIAREPWPRIRQAVGQ